MLAEAHYVQAWQRAQAMRADWEGDAEYDYYYGRLAYESGHYNEALFAFERVLTVQPRQHRARLELARAYFSLGDIDRADAELQQVLAIDPPPVVRNNILLFQHEIERYRRQRSTQWLPRVGVQLGSDSNINSATADTTVEIPVFGQLLLSDMARELDDNFSQVDAGLGWLQPLTKRQQLMADVQLSQKSFQNYDSFNQGTASAIVGYRRQIAKNQFNAAIRYQALTLDNHDFQNSTSLSFGWQRGEPGHWLYGANVLYSDIRYPDDEYRDVSQGVLALIAGEKNGRLRNTFTVLYGDESTRLDTFPHNAKQFVGLVYQGAWPLSREQQLNWQCFGQSVQYKSAHPMSLTGDAREDVTLQFSAGWRWQFNPTIQLFVNADYSTNDSNLSLFDYDRAAVSLGARYAFR